MKHPLPKFLSPLLVILFFLFLSPPSHAATPDPACGRDGKGTINFSIDGSKTKNVRRTEQVTFRGRFEWSAAIVNENPQASVCKNLDLKVRIRVNMAGGTDRDITEFSLGKVADKKDFTFPTNLESISQTANLQILLKKQVEEPQKIFAEILNSKTEASIVKSGDATLNGLPPPSTVPVGRVNRLDTKEIGECFPTSPACLNVPSLPSGIVCAETSKCSKTQKTSLPGATTPPPGGTSTTETKKVTRSEEFKPPFAIESFTDLFDKILLWLIRIAVPIGVLMIVFSGILMVTSSGKPEQVNKAKTIFKYAIIGLVIIFIGKGFITLLESILNIGNP